MKSPKSPRVGEPWVVKSKADNDIRATAILRRKPGYTLIEWVIVTTEGQFAIGAAGSDPPIGWELVERLSAASSFAPALEAAERTRDMALGEYDRIVVERGRDQLVLADARDLLDAIVAQAHKWANQPNDYDEDTEAEIACGKKILALFSATKEPTETETEVTP